MILEADRMIADFLSDATNGVNACLALIPLDAGDTRPTNVLTIADESRNDTVARGEPASPTPSISVSVDSIMDLDGNAQVVDADGTIKFRIRVTVDNNVTGNAVRDLSYYMRGTMKSLRRWLTQANSVNRTRNGVYLETILSFAEAIDFPKPDAAATSSVSGYIIASMRLRDLQP